MQTVKHIYPLSSAKAIAIAAALLGLIFGIIFAVLGGVVGSVLQILGGTSNGTSIAGFGLLTIVIFPIVLGILGFIIVIVAAWLYNIIADRVGGIRWDFSNGTLKSVDIMSVAKIDAGLFGIFAMIEGIIVGAISGGIFGLVTGLIGGLIIGLILGFVFGAIGAWLYNTVASLIGGYKFTFQGRGISNLDPMSYAKMVAVLSAIYGFVQGLISLALGSVLTSLAATNPAFSSMLTSSAVIASLGVLGLIFLVISNLIVGFISGALSAFFYNIPAGRNIGRIELDMA